LRRRRVDKMNLVRRGFTKSPDTQKRIADLLTDVKVPDLMKAESVTKLEGFAAWCAEHGANRPAESVVRNMKQALLDFIMRKGRMSRDDIELRRRATLCLGKVSDDIFDDANRITNSMDPADITEALQEVYGDRFKMTIW
jgi:hypothetical protein